MESVDRSVGSRNTRNWRAHKYWVLIAGALCISFLLVCVALQLYSSSGASQLDLSRPDYRTVVDKVDRDSTSTYPSTGALDDKALNQFEQLYDTRLKKLSQSKVYQNDALSDAALKLPNVSDK